MMHNNIIKTQKNSHYPFYYIYRMIHIKLLNDQCSRINLLCTNHLNNFLLNYNNFQLNYFRNQDAKNPKLNYLFYWSQFQFKWFYALCSYFISMLTFSCIYCNWILILLRITFMTRIIKLRFNFTYSTWISIYINE